LRKVLQKGMLMGDISKIRDMYDCNVPEEKIKDKLQFLNHTRYADKFEDYFSYIKNSDREETACHIRDKLNLMDQNEFKN
jgi:hypothetical protein